LSSSVTTIMIIVLILVLLIASAFWGTSYLMKRATRSIIQSLRKNGAISPTSAVGPEMAGIKPRSIFQPGVLRDYKPTAFQFMIKNNVVRMTEDGKVYLSEETLVQSGLDTKLR
jgi:hypothetical protein